MDEVNDLSFENDDQETLNDTTVMNTSNIQSLNYNMDLLDHQQQSNKLLEQQMSQIDPRSSQKSPVNQQDTIGNSTAKQSSQKQSFSLRNLNPSSAPYIKSQLQSKLQQSNKNYNIREAIQKNDLVRIRNGSPGSRNIPYKPKQNLPDKSNQQKGFENEMEKNGISEDLQEINRFNYVLLSRSADFDQIDESQLTSMCNQGSFFNKSPHQSPKMQSQLTQMDTAEGGSKYMLPFQRRLKSISPPRLQICNENYIVYS